MFVVNTICVFTHPQWSLVVVRIASTVSDWNV